MRFIVFGLLVLIGLAAYIRFAPSKVDDWHDCDDALLSVNRPGDGRYTIQIDNSDATTLSEIHQRALQSPRTHVLAGSLEEGCITFITRSRLWGFPDYTTVVLQDGKLTMFGRLRFGKKDFGMNKKRLESWRAGA